jgi:hypothetical protein
MTLRPVLIFLIQALSLTQLLPRPYLELSRVVSNHLTLRWPKLCTFLKTYVLHAYSEYNLLSLNTYLDSLTL